ncbi:MAG: hypothetical protein AAGH19_08455, partial [Pseudomonadota bacterium]
TGWLSFSDPPVKLQKERYTTSDSARLKGTRVTLVYDPEDPLTAIEASYIHLFAALGLFAGGIILIVLGVQLGGGF